MNKIYTTYLLLALIFLSACVKDEENIFDDSASVRMEKTLAEHKKNLVSAGNGWIMSYYPSRYLEYGGYNLIVSFTEDGKTVVTSEAYDSDLISESLYTLKADNGPVLSFDTYNENLHFFSEPDNKAGIGVRATGMGGDYEFIIMESSPERIKLKGKKSDNYIYMTPLSNDVKWDEYIENIWDIEDEIYSDYYEYKINNKVYNLRQDSFRSLLIFLENEDSEEIEESIPYIVTPKGIQLYNPLILDGTEVTEFVFDREKGILISDANTELYGVTTLATILLQDNWFVSYSNLGSYTKGLWDGTKELLDEDGEELYYGYFSGLGAYLGFTFACREGVSTYGGSSGFSYDILHKRRMTISYVGHFDNNANYYYANYFNILYTPWNGTFNLSVDDEENPTWIKLEDVNNPNNWTLLQNNVIYYPYNE